MTSISWRRNLVSRLVTNMSSKNLSYEDAIRKLNSLQSNKSTIEQIKEHIKTGQKCLNIEYMENYLMRTGVPMSKLDELSVIHVAGTKGKGSTSAMCECILRQHGLRTGFYSSPHLVAARERIRIDGRPLSEHEFAQHFHRVYGVLEDTQTFPGDMPKYFAFLTVMAYNVFLKEKVDVAVVEVGIGGVVDYTNVLRKVPVVGITALGLDHTSILGDTLAEIAAAKAGIMKPGAVAYTVAQPAPAMDVLDDVSKRTQCPLTIVPDYKDYQFPETQKPHLPVDIEAYRINASLAIQLAHAWMRTQTKSINGLGHVQSKRKGRIDNERCDRQGRMETKDSKDSTNEIQGMIANERELVKSDKKGVKGRLIYEIPIETVEGLRRCKWPGRYQIIPTDYAMFYLDGAHTKESMEIAAKWFSDSNTRLQEKILIFSATGDRNPTALLQPLSHIRFTRAYFVTPTAYRTTTQNNDNYSLIEQEEKINRCKNHANIWSRFNTSDFTVLESVSEVLVDIKRSGGRPSVMVTGSLHLVGAALSILDPSLSSEVM